MRILFIQPSVIVSERSANKVLPFLPIGLGSVAATLRAGGHEVRILDALTEGWESQGWMKGGWVEIGVTEEEIAVQIRRFRPHLVGFSVSFTIQMPRLRSLARWVKAIHPEIFVVCGGPLPTASPRETLEIPEVDLVVLGEGERTVPRLLDRLVRGKRFDHLSGIAYREPNGRIVIPPVLHHIEDLDSLPMPAYDLLPLKKYFKIIGKRSVPLFASRGCAGLCSFCSASQIFGSKTRYHSADYLLKQIRHLIEFYGVHEFLFDDDTLFSDRQAVEAIFSRLAAENLKIQWGCRNGIDPAHLDEEFLALMRRFGGKRLHFSPESGSRRVLSRILKKSLDLYALEQAMIRSLSAGFKISCHFMIGLPGETLEEVYDTLNFAWKLRSLGVDEFHFSLATPFAGTCLRTIAEQMDCLLPYPEPMFIPYEGCLSTPEFSAEEIVQIRDTAEREFNSRGLVVGLSQRVRSGRRVPRRKEERFFDTVAPQLPDRRIPVEPKSHHRMAEDAV